MKIQQYAMVIVTILLFVGVLAAFSFSAPVLQQSIQFVYDSHKQTTTDIVSSYGFDVIMWRTYIYLNNGLKLWVDGNVNFQTGATYTFNYQDNTNEITSWSLS